MTTTTEIQAAIRTRRTMTAEEASWLDWITDTPADAANYLAAMVERHPHLRGLYERAGHDARALRALQTQAGMLACSGKPTGLNILLRSIA